MGLLPTQLTMVRFLELGDNKVFSFQFSSLRINGLSLTGPEMEISRDVRKLAQTPGRRKKKKFKKIVKRQNG